jgi:hypothetical protein
MSVGELKDLFKPPLVATAKRAFVLLLAGRWVFMVSYCPKLLYSGFSFQRSSSFWDTLRRTSEENILSSEYNPFTARYYLDNQFM